MSRTIDSDAELVADTVHARARDAIGAEAAVRLAQTRALARIQREPSADELFDFDARLQEARQKRAQPRGALDPRREQPGILQLGEIRDRVGVAERGRRRSRSSSRYRRETDLRGADRFARRGARRPMRGRTAPGTGAGRRRRNAQRRRLFREASRRPLRSSSAAARLAGRTCRGSCALRRMSPDGSMLAASTFEAGNSKYGFWPMVTNSSASLRASPMRGLPGFSRSSRRRTANRSNRQGSATSSARNVIGRLRSPIRGGQRMISPRSGVRTTV